MGELSAVVRFKENTLWTSMDGGGTWCSLV